MASVKAEDKTKEMLAREEAWRVAGLCVGQDISERVVQALAWSGLADRSAEFVETFSGGVTNSSGIVTPRGLAGRGFSACSTSSGTITVRAQ